MQGIVGTEDEALVAAMAGGSEEAFRAVVERHAGWLYAAARRQLGDEESAGDATQIVFILLVKRSGAMRSHEQLMGWLFNTLRYTVKNLLRARRRREFHERRAAMVATKAEGMPAVAAEVSEKLDAAVGSLSPVYQSALLLRFYQELPFDQMAAHLRISEGAARKRTARAVELLRMKMGISGQAVSVATLPMLVALAQHPIPATVLHSIAKTALAAKVGAVPASLAAGTKGTALLMATSKVQTGIMVAVAACVVVGVPTVMAATRRSASPVAAPVPVVAAPMSAAVDGGGLLDDPTAAYALKPEQLFAHFPNPPAEVHDMYERKHHPRGELKERGHFIFAYSDEGGLREMGYMTGSSYTVRSLLGQTAGIERQDIDSSASFGPSLWPLAGDVVYRTGAKPEEYVAALQQLVQDELHIKATMTLQNVDHKVIVLKGKWMHDEMLDENPGKPELRLMQGEVPTDGVYPKNPSSWYGGLNAEGLASAVGGMIDEPIVMECEGFPKSVVMKYYDAPLSDIASHFSSKFKEHLLQQVTMQTGLTWTEEVRNVRRLEVGVGK